MKFSGDVMGQSFTDVIADCPVTLLQQMDPTTTIDNIRCWILVQTREKKNYWAEVFLDIPTFFETMMSFTSQSEDVIQIRFRWKDNDDDPWSDIPVKQQDQTVLTLDESYSSGHECIVSNFLVDNSGPACHITNSRDPITGEAIGDLDDPFCIVFHSKKFQSEETKTVCVSQIGFESYVARALKEGKDITRLVVAQNIMCVDGKKRSFSLTPIVWVNSLLPFSRTLGKLFDKAIQITLQRHYQLERLKEDENLWYRLLYWLSDMLLRHKKALKRLTMKRCSEERWKSQDIPPYMTHFYFTKEEARNLGKIILSDGTLLKNTLDVYTQLDGKGESQQTVCLELCRALNIEDSFHTGSRFKKHKAEWVKSRQEELVWREFCPLLLDI